METPKMKLTKDVLKKIIQEEVANIEERNHPVRSKYRVAGVGSFEDTDWYETGKLRDREAAMDAADAEEFERGERKRRYEKEKERGRQRELDRQKDMKRDAANREDEEQKIKGALRGAAKALGMSPSFKPSNYSTGEILDFINSNQDNSELINVYRNNINIVPDADGMKRMGLKKAIEFVNALDSAGVDTLSINQLKRAIDKRGFLKKTGAFLTGKGFNEDITKEDIQKMVQEELEAVTKGN